MWLLLMKNLFPINTSIPQIAINIITPWFNYSLQEANSALLPSRGQLASYKTLPATTMHIVARLPDYIG